MEATLALIVGEGRIQLMRSMDPTALDAHHDLCAALPARRHDLMQIWAELLGVKVRHDLLTFHIPPELVVDRWTSDVRAAHTAIFCFDRRFGRCSVARSVKK